jgi:ketosteroid isomerase-like protein
MGKTTTMSSKNIVAVNRIYEAFQARDFPALLSALSPEIHITQCPALPFGGTFEGREGAKAFFGKVTAYLDPYETIERIIDAGERVAVVTRAHGTVRSTGRKFDVSVAHLWGFEDGLAVRLEIALDVPAMLAALAQ